MFKVENNWCFLLVSFVFNECHNAVNRVIKVPKKLFRRLNLQVLFFILKSYSCKFASSIQLLNYHRCLLKFRWKQYYEFCFCYQSLGNILDALPTNVTLWYHMRLAQLHIKMSKTKYHGGSKTLPSRLLKRKSKDFILKLEKSIYWGPNFVGRYITRFNNATPSGQINT